MMTLIIPEHLKGTDVWDSKGKIQVSDKMTLEEAKRLEFMGVRIIEQEQSPIKKAKK